MYALEVDHLSLHSEEAERLAVEDVSFAIEPGQMVMLIGPNGSGKTTLLRTILGLTLSRGNVKVYGQPIRDAYPLIGYVPQHLRFDPLLPLTGRAMLHMLLRALPRKAQCTPFKWAVDIFRLASFLDQPVGTVSGGQLKRLMLARVMLRQPRLVLLDEPEAGVDIGGEQTLYQVLAQQVVERQVTALISSYEPNMVLHVATQVICLNRLLFGIGPPTQMLIPETLFQLNSPTAALYPHHHGHGEPT
jgi:ABC-type Mn2+/Zn2+ transport system ATPase subunit